MKRDKRIRRHGELEGGIAIKRQIAIFISPFAVFFVVQFELHSNSIGENDFLKNLIENNGFFCKIVHANLEFGLEGMVFD